MTDATLNAGSHWTGEDQRKYSPLEKIVCDPTVDGSQAIAARAGFRNPLRLANDIEAAVAFLQSLDDRRNTRRSYQATLDALFNWAICVRGLAVSAFSPADFAEFDRYLASPELWDSPCGRRRVRRGEPGWRPIRGARCPRSRAQAMACIKSFASWLREVEYVMLEVETPRYSAQRSIYASSTTAISRYPSKTPVVIEQWVVLKHALLDWPESRFRSRQRAFLSLLYYADLTVEECLSLDLARIVPSLVHSDCQLIEVPGRTGSRRSIVALPEVRTALIGWLESEEGDGTMLAFGSRGRNERDFKRIRVAAIVRASEMDEVDLATSLGAITPHCLHHALARHTAGGPAQDLAWRLVAATVAARGACNAYLPERALSDPSLLLSDISVFSQRLSDQERAVEMRLGLQSN